MEDTSNKNNKNNKDNEDKDNEDNKDNKDNEDNKDNKDNETSINNKIIIANYKSKLSEQFIDTSKKHTDDVKNDQEILYNYDNSEKSEEDSSEFGQVIECVFNIFLSKYPHLDNFKNRKIIHNICNIAVLCMPNHMDNPMYYLNFIESSIKIIKDTNDNII
jgi:hypothetical protein